MGNKFPDDFDICLDSAVYDFEHRRREYLLENGEAGYLERVDGLADGIYRASHELEGPLDLLWEDHDWEHVADDVLDALGIRLAHEFSDARSAMALRCVQICSWASAHRSSERVLRFLRKLSRAYIAGFDTESIIMCRAIIDTALDERIAFEANNEHDSTPVPRTLQDKLRLAARSEWISEDVHREATEVRVRGNTAVHDDPTVTTSSAAAETVASTLRVLEQLLPAPLA